MHASYERLSLTPALSRLRPATPSYAAASPVGEGATFAAPVANEAKCRGRVSRSSDLELTANGVANDDARTRINQFRQR